MTKTSTSTSSQETTAKRSSKKVVTKSARATEARGYCLTIFGSDPEILKGDDAYYPIGRCIRRMRSFPKESNYCDYYVFGIETCPETNRTHLQVYIHLIGAKSFKNINKFFDNRAFISEAIAKGNLTPRRWLYCMKGDQSKSEWLKLAELGPNFGLNAKFEEYGVKPAVGKTKIDTSMIMDSIKNGASLADMEQAYPSFMLHHRKKVDDTLRVLSTAKTVDISYEYLAYIDLKILDKSDVISHPTELIRIVYPDRNIITISNMDELRGHPGSEYDIIFFLQEGFDFESTFSLYEISHKIKPLVYRYGYETRRVVCNKFIVRQRNKQSVPGFTKLEVADLAIKYIDTQERAQQDTLIGPIDTGPLSHAHFTYNPDASDSLVHDVYNEVNGIDTMTDIDYEEEGIAMAYYVDECIDNGLLAIEQFDKHSKRFLNI